MANMETSRIVWQSRCGRGHQSYLYLRPGETPAEHRGPPSGYGCSATIHPGSLVGYCGAVQVWSYAGEVA